MPQATEGGRMEQYICLLITDKWTPNNKNSQGSSILTPLCFQRERKGLQVAPKPKSMNNWSPDSGLYNEEMAVITIVPSARDTHLEEQGSTAIIHGESFSLAIPCNHLLASPEPCPHFSGHLPPFCSPLKTPRRPFRMH